MANRHTLCCLLLIPISTVYFLISAQGGNGNQEELQIVSGCSCQGYTVTFQCNAVGNAGWTKWNGSAFNCTNLGNEIIFLHPDGFQSGGTNKTCNEGGIVGQTLPLEDNNTDLYPSRLNVTLTPHLIGRTVKCVYEDSANHEDIIGVINLSPTTDPFHPPVDVRLADVRQGFLKFEWSPVVNNCVSLVYEVNATQSCGSCPHHTTFTSVSCTFNFSHIPGVCRFSIRTIVCNNITGNWSEPVNVTLKVPESVVITAIQADYITDGSLTALAIEFRGSDQDMYMCNRDIASYVYNYSVVYTDAVTGLVCNSEITSNLTSFAPISCFPTNNGILVSLSALNMLGEGPKTNITITETNQYVSLSTSDEGITCRFLDKQKPLSTKLCNVLYGRCTEVQESWTSQWDYTTTDSPFTVNLSLKIDLQDYCYVVSATIDNLTIVITGNHTSKGGGPQQRWKFLTCLVLICVPPAIIIVIFVYWARYRCLCIIAELVSKVTCSHSNGNNIEYPMHAAFELQDKPGELLKLLTIIKDKGINIEATKIGKHTSPGTGNIYMRFTRNLTRDEVDHVKTKVDRLAQSSTGCVIYESPQPFQIELEETMNGKSANESYGPISRTTYSLLVSSSPGALQSFLQGMMKLRSRDGSQYNNMNITGIVDIPIILCKRRLGYLIKLNLCSRKFPRNWWRDLDSIKIQTTVATT